jgi:Recombinational DNA repair protein (RecF pathway)
LNSLLPESQPNKDIYKTFNDFINSINLENWIFLYIFFELNLIKFLGYDPNLSQFVNDQNDKFDTKKIKIDNYLYEVPNYLITKNLPKTISNNIIKKSLYFTRSIIQNRFFLPNNLTFPKTRIILENYFN